MADIRFTPVAPYVAQESHATPASVEVGDIFSLKIGGVTMATFTSAGTTVAGVTAGLVAAWNIAGGLGTTHPWATAVTVSDQTTYVKILANVAGIPFTVTATAVDGGGSNTQTLTITTPTANSSPNALIAANCSTGSLPTNGDRFFIEKTSTALLWALDALVGVTLAELRVPMDFTGLCGLHEGWFVTGVSSNAGTTVETTDVTRVEYRPTCLQVSTTTAFNYGDGNGTGSPRFKVDFTSHQFGGLVSNTRATGIDANLEPLRIKGTHASNALKVLNGNVGIATNTGSETATLATLDVRGGNVRLSSGVSWASIRQAGGNLWVNSPNNSGLIVKSGGNLWIYAASSAIDTLDNTGGPTWVDGTLDVATVNANGGIIYSTTTGKLGSTKIQIEGGVIDFLGSSATRTAGQIAFGISGGTLKADFSVLTPDSITTSSIMPMQIVATPLN